MKSIKHAIAIYGANCWESIVTSGVLHVRLTTVVYMAYITVDFRRSMCLSSRDSHVTFPTVVTVSIVRGSILFIIMNSWYNIIRVTSSKWLDHIYLTIIICFTVYNI